MKLPAFEEFENTITPELVEEWFSSDVFKTRGPVTNDELVTVARRAGYFTARGMIEHYHTWLVEQLDA